MSRFFCNRLFDDVIYAQSNRTQDAVFKRYALHSIKTRTLGTCLLLDSISVTIKRMTNDICFLCWDLLEHLRLFTNLSDLEAKSILFCSLAKQYVRWCPQCCGYEL